MHSDENLVDRRIIGKLLMTYFDRSSNFNDRNRRDVLQLMAKILKFSDDEKKKVGLGSTQPAGGITGRIAAFASFIPNVLFPEVSAFQIGCDLQAATSVSSELMPWSVCCHRLAGGSGERCSRWCCWRWSEAERGRPKQSESSGSVGGVFAQRNGSGSLDALGCGHSRSNGG